MIKITVDSQNEGRRLDKFIFNYLKDAPSSFVYKMLRKKNIVLNTKKADGKELLNKGDEITLFLSDETVLKFSGNKTSGYSETFRVKPVVLFENKDILIVDKPQNMLSQKSADSDISINEICLNYLIDKGEVNEDTLKIYTPSVINRLDRNTSGVILFAKTYMCARTLSEAIRNRTIKKFYYCIVKGIVKKDTLLEGFISKDERSNTVRIEKNEFPGSSQIRTGYKSIATSSDASLLEVELITGKTHQIRAHLASVGHPVIGDPKYGDSDINALYKKNFHVNGQLLFSCRVEFPQLAGELCELSRLIVRAPLPKCFKEIMNVDLE